MFKGFAYYRFRIETVIESTPAETLPEKEISQRFEDWILKEKKNNYLETCRISQELIN